jgi:hypothetical protein
MLLSPPAIGGTVKWPDGVPVEVLLYFDEAQPPFVCQIVRVK